MQKRSLPKIFLYTTLSLGVYELVWLSQTRRELTKLTSVRIASIRWLVLLNTLQLTGIVLGLVLAAMLVGIKSTPVSPACWSEYVLATVPQTSGTVSLSSACRNQVDRNTAATDREDKLIKGYLLVIVLLVVSRLGYPRWLRNYALAVQQVTKGSLSQTIAMFMLVFSSVYGMVAAQNAFNNVDASLPNTWAAEQAPYPATENKFVHKALSLLALTMVTLFGLFIAFLVAVNYYGTHH